MVKKLLKLVVLAIFIGGFYLAWDSGLGNHLTLEQLKVHQAELKQSIEANFWGSAGTYFLIYVALTAISFPGATVLTLGAGALFGLIHGVILVSIASTIGATIAFLASRFLFRDWVREKFSQKISAIEEGFRREGASFLLSLRLIPLFPFFAVNLVMGLTPLSVWKYLVISQIGMLPATFVYVNAGETIASLESLSGILSTEVLGAFAAIGILPWILKFFVSRYSQWRLYRPYSRPKSYDYNLVAIGAGSAGLVTAYIAAAVKSKVALIEGHKMGGDCLNTGCVPSKALLRSAKFIKDISRAEELGLGTTQGFGPVDLQKIMKRVQEKIKKIEPHDSIARYTELGVECLQGRALIRSPFEIEVNGKVLTTKNIVIATGAEPFVPPVPGLDSVGYRTSDNLWELNTLPKRLLIVGGGPIGCEMAQAFRRLGSAVTLIELSPRIMPREDLDVSNFVEKTFRQEGIVVLTNTTIKTFASAEGRKWAHIETHLENRGKSMSVDFDELIMAVGRKARVKGFGLEDLGVELNSNGTLKVDAYMRTKFPNIFAAGDVAGPYQLTHAAAHQAWFCAVNALFGKLKKFKVDYRVLPWVTYTDPEVARVGLNEQEAAAQNIPFEVYRYELDDLDRAIVDSDDHGFVKVLIKPKSDKILGATIVGAHGGEILSEFTLALKYGIGLNKILGTIHPYPTFSEANKFTAGVWKRATAPQGALRILEKYHRWNRC